MKFQEWRKIILIINYNLIVRPWHSDFLQEVHCDRIAVFQSQVHHVRLKMEEEERVNMTASQERVFDSCVAFLKKLYCSWEEPLVHIDAFEEVEAFFSLHSPNRSFVLQGDPGCGKSTLLKQCASQWAFHHFWREVFDVVVLVDLKKVGSATIEGLLGSVLVGIHATTVKRFSEWCESNKERVLWMLDDCDEDTRAIVSHVTQHMYYFVVATSVQDLRASGFAGKMRQLVLRNSSGKVVSQKTITSKGLTKSGITEFVRRQFRYWSEEERLEAARVFCLCLNRTGGAWKTLSRMLGEAVMNVDLSPPNEAVEAVQFLETEWSMEGLASYPFVVETVCSKFTKGTWSSLTQLYGLLVDKMLDGVVCRKALREAAYRGMKKNTTKVSKEVSVRGNIISNGAFLHPSLQKYLAAEFLCFCAEDVGKELRELSATTKDDMLFRFCCGIGRRATRCLSEWIEENSASPNNLGPFAWLGDEQSGALKQYLESSWKSKNQSKLNLMALEASSKRYFEAMEIFVAKGACVNSVSHDGTSMLMNACSSGNMKEVTFLTQRNAEINAGNNYGWTPLMLASQKGNIDIVRHLMGAGARVNTTDFYGRTALMYASQKGHCEIARFLVEQGAQINNASSSGRSALMMASQNGHLRVIKYLVKSGARVEATDFYGKDAAYFSKNNEIRLYLVRKKAEHRLQQVQKDSNCTLCGTEIY